jgi:hypothetical protein
MTILIHNTADLWQIFAIRSAAKSRSDQWSSVGELQRRFPTKHVRMTGISWCSCTKVSQTVKIKTLSTYEKRTKIKTKPKTKTSSRRARKHGCARISYVRFDIEVRVRRQTISCPHQGCQQRQIIQLVDNIIGHKLTEVWKKLVQTRVPH